MMDSAHNNEADRSLPFCECENASVLKKASSALPKYGPKHAHFCARNTQPRQSQVILKRCSAVICNPDRIDSAWASFSV